MANNYFKFKQFTIYHDKCAMKVGTDGVLIGTWTNFNKAKTILDVGCGSGLISIIAAQRNTKALITGIDIDANAVEQAIENAANTIWGDRINIDNIDFCLINNKTFDIIVSNPPYFKENIKSPNISRNIARSCGSLNYQMLIEHSSHLLTKNGKLSIIFPSEYYDEIIEHGIKNKLYPERVAHVYPLPDSKSKRIMVEMSFIQKDTIFEKIVIEKSRHNYSDEYISLTKEFYLNL